MCIRDRVLVATDVAARGVHVDDVELVIHVDPPMEHKAYLHRSGRTARAGAEGTVVTLVTPGQEPVSYTHLDVYKRQATPQLRPRDAARGWCPVRAATTAVPDRGAQGSASAHTA